MSNSLICATETQNSGDGPLFQRRIEFHPARKPFTALSNGSANFHLETLNPGSDSSQRSALNACSSSALAGKKSDAGDVFELGLEPEFSFRITFRRIGAGLQNLGNTCFLNSVLQCLTYTEPFAAYLQSGKHKSSCHIAGFCALCAIQNHVSRALQSTGRILAPKDLVVNLRCISRNFRTARQEDAHEYMVNLLESMHKCCLPSGVPSESPSAYEKSLVHKIFGGRLRSQVKCMQCSYCSNTFDPFLDLSLEINKADSLRKALLHFTAMEQLDGGERQYQCQRCKQKVKALKQLTVHKAPYVLTIHLKRFGSHVPGQKIDKKIEFSPTLDLKPFVSGSYEGDLKYTLYGVLVHSGWSTHSGHYYCFVRTSSGMWHSLDDNRVVQVSEKTALQQKAYMLFYVRDISNIGPRKPIDVHKENMVLSAMENRENFVSFMSQKETIPNGPLARGSSNLDCSLAATKIDALFSDSLKRPHLKEASVMKTKGLVMAQGPSLLKDPLLDTSSKEPVKGPSVLHSINGQFVEEGLPQSAPSSVKDSGSTSLPTVATVDAKVNPGNAHQGSKKNLSVLVAALPDCGGSQNYGPDKLVTDKGTNEIGGVVNERVLREAPCTRVNDLKTEKNCSVRLSKQSDTEEKRKEGISNYRDPIDQLGQKAEHNGKKLKEVGFVETSSQSSLMNGCIRIEAFNHHHHRKVPKPKKKIVRSQVASMHLGSKLLFRASLSLCMKKKHRKNRKRSLELRDSTEFDLEEDPISRGLGPSTYDKIQMVDSTHSRRQHKRSSRKKGNRCSIAEDVRHSSSKSVTDVTEGDFRERIVQSSVELATNEPLPKSSILTLAAKQQDARELDNSQDKKRELFQNGFSMLTRGLEITVERWDGINLGPSQILEPNNAECISIGYVPDEWDEEYDRGKRKKVRNSFNSFGGPNPFQEIATTKANFKKAKMEKASSGNHPLRI